MEGAGKILCKPEESTSGTGVFPGPDVDSVDNLLPEKGFPDSYDISGAHSYQQIAVHTFF